VAACAHDFDNPVSLVTVLQMFVDVLVNALQYHLMFLLKVHVVFVLAFSLTRNVFEISLPVSILLVWKELKYRENFL
jgi:hypothetical protein